jgi:hypothetical protein
MKLKKYNPKLRLTNITSSDDVSNYSNTSFLSVRLLIWKSVACLKSAISGKNRRFQAGNWFSD